MAEKELGVMVMRKLELGPWVGKLVGVGMYNIETIECSVFGSVAEGQVVGEVVPVR